jgi:hypothetical protein
LVWERRDPRRASGAYADAWSGVLRRLLRRLPPPPLHLPHSRPTAARHAVRASVARAESANPRAGAQKMKGRRPVQRAAMHVARATGTAGATTMGRARCGAGDAVRTMLAAVRRRGTGTGTPPTQTRASAAAAGLANRRARLRRRCPMAATVGRHRLPPPRAGGLEAAAVAVGRRRT